MASALVTSMRMCFRVAAWRTPRISSDGSPRSPRWTNRCGTICTACCRQADGWTSRDEAATALGVGRPVAAFRLDKLVEAGVVEIRFERLTGRSGPGAGRPAKLYRPARSTSPRRSRNGTTTSPDRFSPPPWLAPPRAGSPWSTASRPSPTPPVARSAPRRGTTGMTTGSVLDALRQHGYEPRAVAGGDIVLANCPFHRLGRRAPIAHLRDEPRLPGGSRRGPRPVRRTVPQAPARARVLLRSHRHLSARP